MATSQLRIDLPLRADEDKWYASWLAAIEWDLGRLRDHFEALDFVCDSESALEWAMVFEENLVRRSLPQPRVLLT
jgi:hypothetical protein